MAAKVNARARYILIFGNDVLDKAAGNVPE